MLNKLKAIWNLFRAGEAVADPTKWKQRQISSTMLAAFIVALVQLAKLFNIDLPIDDEAATAIAAGILAVVNVVLTLITSRKVGVGVGKDVPAQIENSPETPVEIGTNAHISDETRQRAEQWVNNGLQNDA